MIFANNIFPKYMPPTNGTNHNNDDEYKKATKEVVDDMFRDDVLGPRICSVLENHTPASSKVKNIIADAIENHPECKKAIEIVMAGLDTKRKGKWVDRGLGAFGAIVIGLLIWGIPYLITNFSQKETSQQVLEK
ncbi:hypothetical protein A2W67_00445 [Candidatus Nomurabacteria bacterium RIFCSPLOWO2_02_40_28]|nr:MAG: hypothetical protein A2W50_02955 [Candidatus Nomurabacteria bacterium RIFCSPHIGHO2_02_40_30]OGI79959.1 MAG: hypothetical protein A2W43_03460 [Candidatus Nomurabacteria bacterium RIFCSPHIGHO2_12_40_11]OGI82706.1 MAG: hypothetical protein A3E33_01150 [Candidatus Nomurabacteria bacterium RIFCSPHIGHO2_12_FULL_40_77]OGI96504.1 MAG: hypothetical protein A2W67_00445 [Candidatus Nomurabacteria bacterium RIFCSPLOWO2_02_40_28]HBA46183.1 hypothetical protein [Candidatus Nomurabacteria bacterium]